MRRIVDFLVAILKMFLNLIEYTSVWAMKLSLSQIAKIVHLVAVTEEFLTCLNSAGQ